MRTAPGHRARPGACGRTRSAARAGSPACADFTAGRGSCSGRRGGRRRRGRLQCLLRRLLVARVTPAEPLAVLVLRHDIPDDPGREREGADDDDARHPGGRVGEINVRRVEGVPRVLEEHDSEEDEQQVEPCEDPRQHHPEPRELDRTWPIRTAEAKEQHAAQREHVGEHVAGVARGEDEEKAREDQDQRDVQERVEHHRACGYVVLVQHTQLLDRHSFLGQGIERSRAVHRRRVHRQEKAPAEADREHRPEPVTDDRVHDVNEVDHAGEVADDHVVADRPQHRDREQTRENDVHPAGHHKRLAGVVLRVLVLRRERRGGLGPVGGPAEDVKPDHDERELVEPSRRVSEELDGGRDVVRPDRVVADVAGEERAQGDDDDRDDHHRRHDVAEPHGRAHAADVEGEADDDRADADQLGRGHRREPGRIPAPGRDAGVRAGELADQEQADEASVHREHARPREPVAEDGNRPSKREVLAPAFTGVDGETARLVGEHRRGLAVDVRLQCPDDRGDDPQRDRPRSAQVHDREGEPDQQETRVCQADDHPVVPPHSFEKTTFVNGNLSHAVSLGIRASQPTCRATISYLFNGLQPTDATKEQSRRAAVDEARRVEPRDETRHGRSPRARRRWAAARRQGPQPSGRRGGCGT